MISTSVNRDIDYDALADKIASDDWEPTGRSWSLLDLAEVRAFELLRREYVAQLSDLIERPQADAALMRFLTRCRDDAEARLAEAKTRALDAGIPESFIESVVTRETLA